MMSRGRPLVAIGVAALVALGVGLGVWLSSGGDPKPLSHEAYAQLFAEAVPLKTRIDVIDRWPKPPYQDFHDSAQNHCFEWWDKPEGLYTLCFKNGLLSSKNRN